MRNARRQTGSKTRSRGARTPDELDTLLEDALIVGDVAAVRQLFEEAAVLAIGDEPAQRRGAAEIADAATLLWSGDRTYIATPRRVLQARDLALTVGSEINVLRRGSDRTWRYAISLMSLDRPTSSAENED